MDILKRVEKYKWILFSSSLLIAAILFSMVYRDLWQDELVDYFNTFNSKLDIWRYSKSVFIPPLYLYTSYFFGLLIPDSLQNAFLFRFPSLLYAIASTFLVIKLLIKNKLDKRTSIFFGLLFLCHPVVFYWAAQARYYSLSTFAGVFYLYCLNSYISEKSKRNLITLGLSLVIVFYSNYILSFIVLFTCALTLIAQSLQKSEKRDLFLTYLVSAALSYRWLLQPALKILGLKKYDSVSRKELLNIGGIDLSFFSQYELFGHFSFWGDIKIVFYMIVVIALIKRKTLSAFKKLVLKSTLVSGLFLLIIQEVKGFYFTPQQMSSFEIFIALIGLLTLYELKAEKYLYKGFLFILVTNFLFLNISTFYFRNIAWPTFSQFLEHQTKVYPDQTIYLFNPKPDSYSSMLESHIKKYKIEFVKDDKKAKKLLESRKTIILEDFNRLQVFIEGSLSNYKVHFMSQRVSIKKK